MRQRLFLLIIGFLAFGWVLFSSYDLLSNENLVNFRYYFSAQDKKVYVIQDPQVLDWNNESILTTELNKRLYFSILKNSEEQFTYFFSAKGTKIMIEKKGVWTKKEVLTLLQNGLFKFQMGKLKHFEYGQLHGYYNGNQLIIYEGELPKPHFLYIPLSGRASYAWWNWDKKKELRLTETYIKKEGYYRYVKYKNLHPSLHKVDDQAKFAGVVPDFFKQYYFYEKNYVAQLDPKFKTSPWFSCIENGFVHLKKDSSSLVIFDYAENANPIQTLNEFFRKEELNTESATYDRIQFSSLISTQQKTWHVGVFGQYGFASSDKALLDQALAAATLGQTFSQDLKKSERIYKNMPRKVSARWVDASQKKTITLLGKQVVETSFSRVNQQNLNNQEEIRDYFVMNPGFAVLGFAAFAERGNIIAHTENHQLVGYINGLRKWEKPITQEVKAIYAIPGYNKAICVQFENEAQLYDKTGKLLYKLPHKATSTIQVLEFKGKNIFLCSNSANSMQLIADNGSIIKQFSGIGKIRSYQGFKDGASTSVSILTDGQYQIFDLNKNKMLVKQIVDTNYVLSGNQHFSCAIKIQKNNVQIISVAGQKQFQIPSGVKYFGSYMLNTKPVFVLKRGTALFAYDITGTRIWEKTINAIELDQFTSYQNQEQKTYIGLLDAIGNQIYLLDDIGRNIDNNKRHGAKELQITAFGKNAYSISTYLGNFIIQYTKQ
jgi:hypothetical protein